MSWFYDVLIIKNLSLGLFASQGRYYPVLEKWRYCQMSSIDMGITRTLISVSSPAATETRGTASGQVGRAFGRSVRVNDAAQFPPQAQSGISLSSASRMAPDKAV
ncbi:hypothetical protein FHS82_001973 [Pseudochelatococcus lubricantis]|uniref:Uncharacterized protein n=1 Tax=Pseudochelatococcus lubricantis TaxID=1538102 RepID=A0ABX0V4W1_9HYPH|nr:hypothetical protein [Pseudochelatococcus lubricantis]NIJ58131.1 hypothetical protein [Pseudochelatococcus lubricantis]